MIGNLYQKLLILLFLGAGLLVSPKSASSEVYLPRLVSDGMVLQRGTEVNIWGWADEGEEVTVRFLGRTHHTVTGENGKWSVRLPSMKAGGPYSMQIDGKNHVVLTDILVGDVWICSGQSNMLLPMDRVRPLYEDAIEQSENDMIRQFQVPMSYDFKSPQEDLEEGSWQPANPWSVLDFSATAYFFARSMHEEYGVPVGLINASVGGTPISAWMSGEALKQFPSSLREAKKFSSRSHIDSIVLKEEEREAAWNEKLWSNDRGLNGGKEWYDPGYDTSDWPVMTLPAFWEDRGLANIDGAVWFRRDFTVSEPIGGRKAKLLLGRITDADYVYVNGVFVGSTSYKYPPRRYEIAPGILKKGSNTIVIRVVNYSKKGGFIEDKPYKILNGGESIDLTGKWKYKLGVSMDKTLPNPTFIHYKPTGLFNGMIAPLLHYTIKGAVWYQGESDIGNSEEYLEKFSSMIGDWRDKWNQGTFPFLYVQLPNYGRPSKNPGSASSWARIREAQRNALKIPDTGMAITIDIGEWNDIHPLNKQGVGSRLALAARKVAYGEDNIVFSGPLYESMQSNNQKIILSFSQAGKGLKAKGRDSLNGFAISGDGRNFVEAQAKIISRDKVMVWSDSVTSPVAVRYAWADNPDHANLYNNKGLPASPFMTGKGW